MKTYFALYKESGMGCDHSIACGLDWYRIEAHDLDDAIRKARHHHEDEDLETLIIVEAASVTDISKYHALAEREAEIESAKEMVARSMAKLRQAEAELADLQATKIKRSN